jgi:23S rRNA pseudouridine1911/1915/1917 synthase
LINHSENKRAKAPDFTEYAVTEPGFLLDFLLRTLTKKSRNNVKSLLTHKEVSVDGRVVTRHDQPLTPGQTVRVLRASDRDQKKQKSLPVIYEDDELLVISKPAGLLTIATDNKAENTAYRMMTDYVRQVNPGARLFIVHRLDRDTSGLVLFAKNERLKLALQDNWNELVSVRGYIALVEGRLDEKTGRIRSWLKETKTLLMYSGRPGDGQEAITNYQVLREGGGYSLVDIRLETGRKNQIRVHMKELGHPVAGDRKYGAKTDPLKRLGLHAHRLELRHPFTEKPLCFDSPAPKSFDALIDR